MFGGLAMREDESGTDLPEHFDAHKNDPEWQLVTSAIQILAIAAIAWFDHEYHRLRESECPNCGAQFLSLRAKAEHNRNAHPKLRKTRSPKRKGTDLSTPELPDSS